MKTLKQIVNALLTLKCSQDELAKVAGVSQMTISRWSKANPSKTNTKALAKLEKHVEKVKK